MKQGLNSRRSRGRGNPRGRNPNPRNQQFDSNGPEGRIRGTANQIVDRYLALARDAQSSGDTVSAEYLLQHAEHYYRIISANAPNGQMQQRFRSGEDQPDYGDGDGEDGDGQGAGGQDYGQGQRWESRGGENRFRDYDTGSDEPSPQGERQDRTERQDRAERPERAERQERADRPERAERSERAERPERAERTDRGERAERSDRDDQAERVDAEPAVAEQGVDTEAPSAEREPPRRQRRERRRFGRSRQDDGGEPVASGVAPGEGGDAGPSTP